MQKYLFHTKYLFTFLLLIITTSQIHAQEDGKPIFYKKILIPSSLLTSSVVDNQKLHYGGDIRIGDLGITHQYALVHFLIHLIQVQLLLWWQRLVTIVFELGNAVEYYRQYVFHVLFPNSLKYVQ